MPKFIIEIVDDELLWGERHKLINDIISLLEKKLFIYIKFPANLEIVELSILLIDDDYMRELNYKYRGKDKTTNILSFPAEIIDYRKLESFSKDEEYYAGDLLISLPQIEREAEGESFADYLTHIILHGILHLFGFDHEEEKDAEIMESKESEILGALNILSPYINQRREIYE